MYSRLAARKRVVALWDQRRLTAGYGGRATGRSVRALRPESSGVRLASSAPPFRPPGSAPARADLPRDESR